MPLRPITQLQTLFDSPYIYYLDPTVAALSGGGFVTSWTSGIEVFVGFHDVSGALVKPVQQVGEVGVWESAPDVAQLNDGNVVVVYSQENDPDALIGAMFDGAGNPLTDAAPLFTQTDWAVYGGKLAPLSDGGFAVSYINLPRGNGDAGIRLFAEDATARGGMIPLELPDDTLNENIVDIIALSGGGFAVLYTANDRSYAAPQPGYLKVFDGDGTPITGDVEIVAPEFDATLGLTMAQFPEGRIIVAWTLTDPDGVSDQTFGRMVSADGTDLGEPFLISPETAGQHYRPEITVLAGGQQAVVTWIESGSIKAQLVNFDGTLSGAPIDLTVPADGVLEGKEIAALDDGGFVALWAENETRTDEPELLLQAFDLVPQPTSEDDRLGGTYAADILSGLEGDDFILGRGGDDRLDGDAGNDTLYGGDGSDTLLGLTGNDVIVAGLSAQDGRDVVFGGAGDDSINAGHGNDALYGGDGNDTLMGGVGDDVIQAGETETDLRDLIYAGAGDDSVDGGHGNDEIFGADGADTLIGGFGVDTIAGQDGDDLITGGAWSDLLFGNTGSDFINGGFGYDRVNGGAGADRFFHLGVAGHGSDWVQDFAHAQGDVLQYGGIADGDRFQVNIASTDGAGAADVAEAFVIDTTTGQILWALVDGAAQDSLMLRDAHNDSFDLLA